MDHETGTIGTDADPADVSDRTPKCAIACGVVTESSEGYELSKVVETALARALVLAAEAKRWDVVMQIADELHGRRVGRPRADRNGARRSVDRCCWSRRVTCGRRIRGNISGRLVSLTRCKTLRTSKREQLEIGFPFLFALVGVLCACSRTTQTGGEAAAPQFGRVPATATNAPPHDRPVSGDAAGSNSGEPDILDCPSDDDGRGSEQNARDWIGSASAPVAGWWQAFVEEQSVPRRKSAPSRLAAATMELDIHGLDATSSIRRAYRESVGRYRVCHEAALSQKSVSASAGERTVNGYWVARIVHGKGGHMCGVEVVHTTFPSELSACLQRELRGQRPVGGEPGKLEVVLTFYEP
jgi:hypothetical protein